MAKMSVSIPDDLAEAFDKAFEGKDKDAVIAGLMRTAVEERERERRSGNFVERARRIRASGRAVSDEEIRRARQELRD
jgi:metal-responsive CopG/Arc/MetJ family transcriptional regulator